MIINPLISAALYILLRNRAAAGRLLLIISIFGISSLLCLHIIGFEYTKFIASFSLRRFLFMPVLIESFVFDYFSNQKLALWSQSGITFGLIEKQYDTPLPNLIGRHYFGSIDMYALVCLLQVLRMADMGVLLYSFLFITLTKLLLNYNGFDRTIVASVVLPFLISMLRSTDPLVALNTNGLLIFLLLLYFFKSKDRVAYG